MRGLVKLFMAAIRTSEFWVMVGQAITESISAPVPDDLKTVAWGYVAVRVLGKLAKFIFPNPGSPSGGWMKADG